MAMSLVALAGLAMGYGMSLLLAFGYGEVGGRDQRALPPGAGVSTGGSRSQRRFVYSWPFLLYALAASAVSRRKPGLPAQTVPLMTGVVFMTIVWLPLVVG